MGETLFNYEQAWNGNQNNGQQPGYTLADHEQEVHEARQSGRAAENPGVYGKVVDPNSPEERIKTLERYERERARLEAPKDIFERTPDGGWVGHTPDPLGPIAGGAIGGIGGAMVKGTLGAGLLGGVGALAGWGLSKVPIYIPPVESDPETLPPSYPGPD